MIDRDEAEQLLLDAGHLFSADGTDLGAVKRFYLDEYSGWPSFGTVAAADADRPGSSKQPASDLSRAEIFVALHEAVPVSAGLEVPYPLARLQAAPCFAADQDPSIEEEDALFDYYGVPIDGADPVVEHLGTVLAPADGRTAVEADDLDPRTDTTTSTAIGTPEAGEQHGEVDTQ